ncbi:MAG: RidA family protein [Bacteroidales bacterium]|nr:RidA family protein [Bacteroidales bacterium]
MKKIISTSDAPQAIGPYNQAVEVKGMLFISGQIPIDPTTGKVESLDIQGQTKQVLKNLEAILKEAGYTLKDVVKTTCLLTDIADFKSMNEIYACYFSDNSPTRATFAVKDLPLGVKIEIDAIAVK